ncbi:bifunctional riboflavin kinase/FAD synthetase [Nakamurella antarctica]|uniref:Riboflavin biosynthesis protein n=1 Tax=Nakamurella antarctica TaxID=1902245 RepID=A0A3G8ZVP5_9ACTN|nr:bifunctional riboflavin kinase/FAD synthetase [Nakamurella antarctica]AZI58086.1 bifunctional riboflavin kinase/FAD synthetase [Nakamurella antarctica]
MQRWRGLDSIPTGWGRCVATIGVFDGVHRGHQLIIRTAVARAKEMGLPSVVITFDPHPSEVLRPGSHPAELTSLRRRAELVEELGADVFCVLPFDLALASTSATSFIHEIMVARLHVAGVVVGEDFRFGHKGAGELSTLIDLGARWGFVAEGVPLVGDGSLRVSSTFVRACVAAGDMRPAALALGREHRLEGVVVHGDGRGTGLGIPTANLDAAPHAAIPADGVYAAWFNLGSRRSPAAVSIGTNPTFEGHERRVEAFVLRDGANFYGRRIGLDFVERLRGMWKFDSVDLMMAEIDRDIARTHEILGTSPV